VFFANGASVKVELTSKQEAELFVYAGHWFHHEYYHKPTDLPWQPDERKDALRRLFRQAVHIESADPFYTQVWGACRLKYRESGAPPEVPWPPRSGKGLAGLVHLRAVCLAAVRLPGVFQEALPPLSVRV
jgi:hypothetical protein